MKSVALTVLELLAVNDQKFRASRDPSHALFSKILRVMFGLLLETCVSNLKSTALSVLELLALINYKIRGSRDLATPPHVRTVSVNMLVKFEARSFNRFYRASA